MKKVNILLVEDEVLLREGLRSLLIKESFIKNVFEAGDAVAFHRIVDQHTIDLILMDVRLPGTNGLELMIKLRGMEKDCKVIAVTGLEGVELMINLLKQGVNGIVFKLDGYNEILKAIQTVLETSDNYFPEKIVRIIQTNAHRWDQMPPVLLTPQERDMMKAIAQGLTTKEIATHLRMSEGTTETYRVRLIKKLGVANTAALLAYAYRNGIL